MKVKQPKANNHKTEVVTSQEEMDRENEGVPMERGWSWVIAIISFLDMFVVVGYTRSLSVLFVDIVQAFQETNTVISLMFTVHSLAGSISSVMISNIVMKRFDVRTITVFCAMINGVASILVSFAPNIVIFLLLFIVKGVAFGGLILCPLSMIGFYFNKRRAMASSLGSAGFCVAYIAFPPLTEILR
ncbi:monocarboxylate transporter 9-like [Physella acuta]|uniref:monocarboxylate transporter 9-like n=1 Tax=Physella acuta TaxID=109671 RepID=UPI0027DAD494|nr:monocarboxylate transporter 9-like [Physella acuta]